MIRERKIYLGCLIGVALVTVWTVFLLVRSWSIGGVPSSLLVAQSLAVAGGLLTVSLAWRAFQGDRPTPRDPVWIASDLLTPAALLLILAVIWAELRR